MMVRILPLLMYLLVPWNAGIVHAQEIPEKQLDVARLAEDLVGTPEDDEQFEASYEELVQTLSRPVNLNHSNLDVLVSLGLLTNQQARAIVDYRQKYDAFLSFYELQAVPGWDRQTIEKILPFVTVVMPVSLHGYP